MILNVRDKRAKARAQQALVRMMVAIERRYKGRFGNLIKEQYRVIAKEINDGRDKTYNGIIRSYETRLRLFFRDLYNTTVTAFFKEVQKAFENQKGVIPTETKDFETDFWNILNTWILTESVSKAAIVNTTTLNTVRRLLFKGFSEGKTNAELSKMLVDRGIRESRWRADTIVRTETHTASMTAIDTAMVKSKQVEKKQWENAGDRRVRKSPFNHEIDEIVGVKEFFYQTGEKMKYPGWSGGSTANIVRCRCVALYFTAGAMEE